MPLPCAGTYCRCQPTSSHQCSREFLSLVACGKHKVVPNIQSQGPLSRPRTTLKDKDHPQGQGQGLTQLSGSNRGYQVRGDFDGQRSNVVGVHTDKFLQDERQIINPISVMNQRQHI